MNVFEGYTLMTELLKEICLVSKAPQSRYKTLLKQKHLYTIGAFENVSESDSGHESQME
jgi:hypothetical protein